MAKDETWSVDRINQKDWLLVAAKVGTILVRVFVSIGMAAIGIVGSVTVINGGVPPEGMKIVVEGAQSDRITGAVMIILVIAMASLALVYDFVTRLAQIIDTVGQGDPFTGANAKRLTRMGWTAIAIQALAIPSELLSGWLQPQLTEHTFSVNSNFSFTGIGLALVLFILARIFRKGTEMREDLEGTV